MVYGRGLLRQNLPLRRRAEDIDKVLTAFDPTDSTALLCPPCALRTPETTSGLDSIQPMLLLHPSSSATERREVVIRRCWPCTGKKGGVAPCGGQRRLAYGSDSTEPRGKGDSEPEPLLMRCRRQRQGVRAPVH